MLTVPQTPAVNLWIGKPIHARSEDFTLAQDMIAAAPPSAALDQRHAPRHSVFDIPGLPYVDARALDVFLNRFIGLPNVEQTRFFIQSINERFDRIIQSGNPI